MEHFELTQDPEGIEEPKGMQRSLFFVPNPYTTIWVSTDSPEQLDLAFWTDSRPPGHWCHRGYAEVTSSFLFATPTIWVSMDSPGHQQSRFGIFSWLKTTWTLMTPRSLLFCSKSQQYGCLQTPLDPSNQDLAFWVDSGQPGHWGLRGLVEVTLLFLFQTPTIFSLDTSDQDLTFWAESGQPGHWGLQWYA